MNLSVAPSSARRSKRRLATYEAKHQQLADEVLTDWLCAELERELLPADDDRSGHDPRHLGMI